MIDFTQEHDRLNCRDAIANAIDTSDAELSLSVIQKFGEPLRDLLLSAIPDSDDLADAEQEISELKNQLSEQGSAFKELIKAVELARDELEEGSVWVKLDRALGKAENFL